LAVVRVVRVDAVEDRTREVNTHPSWESPAEIIEGAAAQYREDLWVGQRYRPEVWILRVSPNSAHCHR
jgi:hypothetical protein